MRPLIGVTRPEKGGWTQNIAIRLSLFICGAKSINISPNNKRENIKLDGLIVSGGTDIHPERYSSDEVKDDYKYDLERDELEWYWIDKALKQKLPIFSICRGAQLLNIYLGGNLFEDIEKSFENAKYPSSLLAKIFFRKKINVFEGTRIYKAFNKKLVKVNSMHSQSIKDLGQGLKITSKEDNGIIQSIENTSENYLIGLQFHPEFLIYRKEIRKLFGDFINVARK